MMTRRAPNTSRGHGRGQLSQAGRRQQVSIKRKSRIYPVCRPAGLKAPLGRAPRMKRQRRLSALLCCLKLPEAANSYPGLFEAMALQRQVCSGRGSAPHSFVSCVMPVARVL